MAEVMDDRENAPSPDSKCSICLSRISNKSFTDRCFHMFCFGCLVEWSKRNAVCPLCKQSFTQIFHNIQSLSKYDIYDVMSHPSYLPSFSSVNFLNSNNRLTMAGHISPFNTPYNNDNEFVITISPDSNFNDHQVMLRPEVFNPHSSHLNDSSSSYNWTQSELLQLRTYLMAEENVSTMKTWLQNELMKISRLVTRVKPSNIPGSVERMIAAMKRDSYNPSTFFLAMSFYIESEYRNLFLVRLKSYFKSIQDSNLPHENLESFIESASINTLLNNSPFQENSNSSGSSLVVDSDIEITNDDIRGGNFVANHRQKNTLTSSDHFISGLIQPENSNTQQPCSFSLVVSIPRFSSGDSLNVPSSSTRQQSNIDEGNTGKIEISNESKLPICVSSEDDDDEVIDLVRPEETRKEVRRVAGKKRVYSLTSDEDDDLALATTSRCKVRKMRKKKMKKSHSPQPSHSIAERNVFHVTSKNKVIGSREVGDGRGRRKFKKHHSGHKNSLRKAQEAFDELEGKNDASDGSVPSRKEKKECDGGFCAKTTVDKKHDGSRLMAFEALFPEKMPSQILNKNTNISPDVSRINTGERFILSQLGASSSKPTHYEIEFSRDNSVNSNFNKPLTFYESLISRKGDERVVVGCGGSSEIEMTGGNKRTVTEAYDRELEDSVNEVRISDMYHGKNEGAIEDQPNENTPLDFSLKNFDLKVNKAESSKCIEEDIEMKNKEVSNSSTLTEDDDYCVIEKEVDTISLHSEDSIQVLYHKNKDRSENVEEDAIIEGEGGDDDVEEIPF